MTRTAPRTIDAYLRELRECLRDEDPALIQDALNDAEEYLRDEVASHAGKSEADVLELIARTYGAPEEVADAYRDTEAKVRAALIPPRPRSADKGAVRRLFGVFGDVRAYISPFFLLLALPTGVLYFVLAVAGLSISAGLAVLIVGVPFFLAFIGLTRMIALGEGRLIEATTGERMPRRPVHPGARRTLWQRIGDMLRDVRTRTTLAYFVLRLPLGIAYFVVAVVGLAIGTALPAGAVWEFAGRLGLHDAPGGLHVGAGDGWIVRLDSWPGLMVGLLVGILMLTLTLQAAPGLARMHAKLAKTMLVVGSGSRAPQP